MVKYLGYGILLLGVVFVTQEQYGLQAGILFTALACLFELCTLKRRN